MRFTSLMTAAAVIAGSASLMQPAHAQFQEIIEGIGFGKDKEPIEYRERAPLVGSAKPQPASAGGAPDRGARGQMAE